MLKKVFLGIDLGGTGVKAGVFDEEGNLQNLSRQKWKPEKNSSGYFEVSPEKILDAAKKTVARAAAAGGAEISGLSVASQGQTFVSLDKNDRPLHNAILWYDSRAGEHADKLNKQISGAGGIRISPICTAAKILWIKEKYPSFADKARRHLLLPDLLNYKLTGNASTDPSTASTTGFYSGIENRYDKRTLEAAGIPESRLSNIIPTGKIVGRTTRAAAKEWGLKPGTPVISGTNDQYAGALGAGNCRKGILTETTGTCMASVALTEKPPSPVPGGLFTGKFPLEEYYYLLAYSKTAGILLDWFTEEFCAKGSLKLLEKSAGAVPPGSNGVFVMPDFDGSVSPVPDKNMKGAFMNLTLKTSRADIFRAVLESLGYSLKEHMAHIKNAGAELDTVRSAGGGAKNSLWLQIKSDIINYPVERPLITETAVLGAAMIAAAGTGCFKTLAEASVNFYKPGKTFYPDMETHRTYFRLFREYSRFKKKILERNNHPEGAAPCKKP